MEFCRSCGKCCFQTEMLLSAADIQRIEATNPSGYSRGEFTIREGHDTMLRNIDGHCIFLKVEDLSCQIYENRPQGCRFYPLIYDLERDKCTRDEECPFRHKFYKKKPVFQKICRELKDWVHSELLPRA